MLLKSKGVAPAGADGDGEDLKRGNQFRDGSERIQYSPNPTDCEVSNWGGAPFYKKSLLIVTYTVLFLLLDRSSTAFQAWAGTPVWYLPVGLTLALLLCGGVWCAPVVFAASLIAALLNYHRALFSFTGIPGSIAVYLGYVVGAGLLRGRWRIDPKLGHLRDVVRFVSVLLTAAILSTIFGVLTMLGDGLVSRSEVLSTMVDWWEGDAIAIVTFTPFLLLYVTPWIKSWMAEKAFFKAAAPRPHRLLAPSDSLERVAQIGCIALAIWLVFGFTPATSYQLLYILFIPVIWISVRHGLPGATISVFAIDIGMMVAAHLSRASGSGLLRLQLAMLVLGLTGLCVGAVVSERKGAERALQDSEERTRSVVETALDAVVTMNDRSMITGWNSQAERSFGWSHDEAMGRRMSEIIIPSQYRELHDRGLRRFLETGEGPALNKRFEISALHRDGHELPVELAISPIMLAGTWTFSAFIRDITLRKQTEMELKVAKEAAEAASRAKSEFLANMSHEIRTPMNGIIGMTELALETALAPDQKEYLTMVKTSADALLTVINDILDFSKIEAGKLDLEVIEVNLRSSLANVIKTLALRAHEKGLELAYQIAPEVPRTLLGDPGRLRQIAINLIGNAIKFTERGEVFVRVEQESRTETATVLHFSIADTGIGIPHDKLQFIFKAFTQSDSSTTRKYGGTGLGLAISAQLVTMMGGRIWVESEIDRGSTFHFTTRLEIASEPAAKPFSVEPINLHDKQVLVVDDNQTNRRILDQMLTGWHMKPVLAESGHEALACLERNRDAGIPFPLVLLDAQMPDMDGFALAERIKQNPELAGATVMMLTSGGQRGDAKRCRELGISAYLTKPIRQSDLLEAIIAIFATGKISAEPPPLVTRHSLRETRRRFNILLAEDNAVNQFLAVRLLEKRGHTVVVTNNGREALAALDGGLDCKFDLVIVDVQMPVMNGFELTAAIRENEEETGRHLPILAMTANAMQGDREKCLEAGMDGYVSKPIQTEELFLEIECLVPTILGSSSHPRIAIATQVI